MLKTKDDIKLWLDAYEVTNYTINDDLTVDVYGDVNLYDKALKSLPVQFSTVQGFFDCRANQLTSLNGCPKVVSGDFNCCHNNLSSLESGPTHVGNDFNCRNNQLTSLKGAPDNIDGSFDCRNNKLTTLAGSPKKVDSYFDCSNNQLTSLEGAPQTIGGSLICHENKLTSLEGSPENVGGDIYALENNFERLGNISTQIVGNYGGSPIPELSSCAGIDDDGDYFVYRDNFNAKVNELKQIREEKALFESSVAKLCDSTPIGSSSEPKQTESTPQQTIAPKRKIKI